MSMRSENINELAKALSIAQGEIKSAVEDKTNPHFKSSYASLASVWDACRIPLSKNELSIMQLPFVENGELYLKTTLAHSSGQFVESVMPVNNAKNTPQALGSCITYMRRYALSSIVGVAPGDDDDANAAQPLDSRKSQKNDFTINSEPVKALGYDEFVKRNDIVKGKAIHDYLLHVCKKSNTTEIKVINSAIKNEEKFLETYRKWLNESKPEIRDENSDIEMIG